MLVHENRMEWNQIYSNSHVWFAIYMGISYSPGDLNHIKSTKFITPINQILKHSHVCENELLMLPLNKKLTPNNSSINLRRFFLLQPAADWHCTATTHNPRSSPVTPHNPISSPLFSFSDSDLCNIIAITKPSAPPSTTKNPTNHQRRCHWSPSQ